MWKLILNKYVLGALLGLAAMGFAWLAKNSYDAELRKEGRAQVQVKFDAYRNKVIKATEDAHAASIKASVAVAAYSNETLTVYRERSNKLFDQQTKVTNALLALPPVDCRLDERLLNDINALRGDAARLIDDTYRPASAVSQARSSGREPRQSR